MGIEFQILGPLEVRIDGVGVAVGGPKQRALLAMLLLSANRVVSRDRLIDELMDGVPADRAERMLRVQVSRLRAVLKTVSRAEPRLVARPPGYVLRVEPGELDFQTFQELLDEGHRALEEEEFERATLALRKAESLWRGRPLADLEFERFARIDIERLQELRLAAFEERVDAELALGRHGMVIAELEARLNEHPLRERLRGQLMLALYRSGRQADALETYRTGRSLLSEELALEPGPGLKQLERAILLQEPVLELSERKPGVLAREPQAVPRRQPTSRTSHTSRRRRLRRSSLIAVAAMLVLAGVAAALLSRESRRLSATANSIAVIDTGSGSVSAVLPAGGPPGAVAAGAGAIWETDTADDLLLEINPRSRSVERIPVGHGPTGVAIGGGEVWVVDQLDRTVSEINPRALQVVGSFAVGNGAGAAAFGDGSLWVSNATDDTISRINPTTRAVSTIPLSGQPAGLAVGLGGLWVASGSTGQLLLIDPRSDKVIQAEQIGNGPAGVAIGAGSVWVANSADGTLSRFDPATGTVSKINVGGGPLGVAFGSGAAWVADSLDGTIARIDPRANAMRVVRVGNSPAALAVNGNEVWTAVLAGPAAHVGGTLTVVAGPLYAGKGPSVDPAQFAGLSEWQLLSLTNDGLVTYRRGGGLAGSTLVPDLATSLPAPTDGGRTYVFQLRRGIRYSTGAPVRPEDFRHELERVFVLGNGYPESFYTGLVGARACMRTPKRCTLATGIETDDATDTVTFHLTAPDPDFLNKLAFPWADAFPSNMPDRDVGRSMPPATGPYMTESISPGHGFGPQGHPLAFGTWVLIRNPRFQPWNPAAQPPGYPDKIVLINDEDPGVAVSGIERGRIDVLDPVQVSAGRLRDLAAHYTSQFYSEPVGATFAMFMNTRVAPFDNVAVRRALNYAIDRNRIVEFANGPLAAQPTCQVLAPNIPGYEPYCPYTLDPNPSGAWRGPDFDRARRLVDSSGTRGMGVTLLVEPPDATDPTTKVGSYVVSVLDRLGYRASLRVSANFYPVIGDSRSHVQIGWFSWYQDYPSPSDFIAVLLTCRSFLPGNPSNVNAAEFCNPRIDAAVSRAQALQAAAPGDASDAWASTDRQIADQAPWLPLYNPRLDIAVSRRVGNYEYHPFYSLLLDQLWVR